MIKVNKQNFSCKKSCLFTLIMYYPVQVLQDSGIGKVEDNLTSADLLSYVLIVRGRPGKLGQRLLRA